MGSGEGCNSESMAGRIEVCVDRSGQTVRVGISDSERDAAWLSVDEFAACELPQWR